MARVDGSNAEHRDANGNGRRWMSTSAERELFPEAYSVQEADIEAEGRVLEVRRRPRRCR